MLSPYVCSDCVALVPSGLSCLPASRSGQLLIFMAERRPVVPGSLGSLVCSLIDGLSVWSNYPRPYWKAGDLVVGPNHTKRNKPPKV